MRKLFAFTLSMLFITTLSFSQKQITEDAVTDNNGPDCDLSRNAAYLFGKFTEGTVYFKNGNTNRSKLNYNTLINEMQFIDPSTRNVLCINNPKEIERINVNGREFYNISGRAFYELVVDNDYIKLFANRHTECSEFQGKGEYGQSNVTSAITNYNSAIIGNLFQKMSVNKELEFDVRDKFIIFYNNKYIPVSGIKTFTKTFPQYKKQIQQYAYTHKINFRKDKDLIDITNFCSQLLKNKIN